MDTAYVPDSEQITMLEEKMVLGNPGLTLGLGENPVKESFVTVLNIDPDMCSGAIGLVISDMFTQFGEDIDSIVIRGFYVASEYFGTLTRREFSVPNNPQMPVANQVEAVMTAIQQSFTRRPVGINGELRIDVGRNDGLLTQPEERTDIAKCTLTFYATTKS